MRLLSETRLKCTFIYVHLSFLKVVLKGLKDGETEGRDRYVGPV